MPNELLAQIFNLVHAQRSHGFYEVLRPSYHLAHICSRWREVVLGTPKLWSTIHTETIVSGLRYTELAHSLTRSRGAPLQVTIRSQTKNRAALPSMLSHADSSLQSTEASHPPKMQWHPSSELLAPHLARISSLELYQNREDLKDSVQLIPLIGPQLRRLCIAGLYYIETRSEQAPPIIDLSMSQLQHVYLNVGRLSWSRTLLPNSLVTLQLREVTIVSKPSTQETWQELFDALQGLSQLTELDIGGESLPHVDGPASELPHIETDIYLPRLLILRLKARAIECAYFLEHLLTPPSTRLAVEMPDRKLDRDTTSRFLNSSMSITNIEDALGSFVLSFTSTQVLASAVPLSVDGDVPSTSRDPADAHVLISMTDLDSTAYNGETGMLLRWCTYTWMDAAREIHISERRFNTDENLWRRVLRTTPHLQSILCENLQFRNLLLLLSKPVSTVCDADSGPATAPRLLVPSLTRIRVPLSTIAEFKDIDWPLERWPIDRWCQMFKTRRAAGCAEIRLELRDDSLLSRLKVQDEDLAKLREVTEVVLL